jgi:hypothetical protein
VVVLPQMLAWFFTFHDSIAKFLVGSPKVSTYPTPSPSFG